MRKVTHVTHLAIKRCHKLSHKKISHTLVTKRRFIYNSPPQFCVIRTGKSGRHRLLHRTVYRSNANTTHTH